MTEMCQRKKTALNFKFIGFRGSLVENHCSEVIVALDVSNNLSIADICRF